MKKLVGFVEELLSPFFNNEEHRADMYLPLWLLAFSIVLIVAGIAVMFTDLKIVIRIGGVFSIALGVVAFLCWKNQTIHIISSQEFEYTTFIGTKKRYFFNEIKGIKKNQDSMTMYVGNDKVHIEFCAIMTKELATLINNALQKTR